MHIMGNNTTVTKNKALLLIRVRMIFIDIVLNLRSQTEKKNTD